MATLQEKVHCFFTYVATKPHMIENKICEDTDCIKQWYNKPTGDGCLSKKWWLGEQWNSDISVSCVLSKHSDVQSENTRFKTLWLSPMTRKLIDVANSCLPPLLILKPLSILLGCPVITVGSCHQDRKLSGVVPIACCPHTGFHYSKILT
jgi:hypothetical protein